MAAERIEQLSASAPGGRDPAGGTGPDPQVELTDDSGGVLAIVDQQSRDADQIAQPNRPNKS